MLPNGALKIIDRKKNIFKLSQGEYVAPEKIENIYVKCPFVDEAFVHGDSLQSFCVGVIVVKPEVLEKFVGDHGLGDNDVAVRTALCKEIYAFGKSNKLNGFEQIKNIHIIHTPLNELEGITTSTFKLKRGKAREFFRP